MSITLSHNSQRHNYAWVDLNSACMVKFSLYWALYTYNIKCREGGYVCLCEDLIELLLCFCLE